MSVPGGGTRRERRGPARPAGRPFLPARWACPEGRRRSWVKGRRRWSRSDANGAIALNAGGAAPQDPRPAAPDHNDHARPPWRRQASAHVDLRARGTSSGSRPDQMRTIGTHDGEQAPVRAPPRAIELTHLSDNECEADATDWRTDSMEWPSVTDIGCGISCENYDIARLNVKRGHGPRIPGRHDFKPGGPSQSEASDGTNKPLAIAVARYTRRTTLVPRNTNVVGFPIIQIW